MSVIRINAITVPSEAGDELARRFAARAGAVDNAEGFEGFELLRPTDGRETWLVVTRWRDEESFQAWVRSPAFAHGHRGVTGDGEAQGHRAHGEAGVHGQGEGGGHAHGHAGGGPVGVASELWSYDVVDLGRGSRD